MLPNQRGDLPIKSSASFSDFLSIFHPRPPKPPHPTNFFTTRTSTISTPRSEAALTSTVNALTSTVKSLWSSSVEHPHRWSCANAVLHETQLHSPLSLSSAWVGSSIQSFQTQFECSLIFLLTRFFIYLRRGYYETDRFSTMSAFLYTSDEDITKPTASQPLLNRFSTASQPCVISFSIFSNFLWKSIFCSLSLFRSFCSLFGRNQFFVGHAIAVLEHENGFLFGLLSNIVGTFELSAPGSIRTTGLLGLPCYMMHPVASRSITLG